MNTARTIAPTLGVWSAYMIAVLVGVHFLTHPFTAEMTEDIITKQHLVIEALADRLEEVAND